MTDRAKAAQADLKAYRTARYELAKLEEDIANVRARVASTSRPPRLVDIQQTRDPKAGEGLLVALADLTAYYDAKRVDVEQMCLQTERRIGQISGIPGLILRVHYIQGKTLEQLAEELEYSYRQVVRLHVTALEQYAKLAFYVTPTRASMAM